MEEETSKFISSISFRVILHNATFTRMTNAQLNITLPTFVAGLVPFEGFRRFLGLGVFLLTHNTSMIISLTLKWEV